MTYQIFKYVNSGQFGSQRTLYQLEGINNKKIMVVGLKRLKRLYKEGRIKGYLPDPVKMKLGLERRKTRNDKGKKKSPPMKPLESPWLKHKDKLIIKKAGLPDIWECMLVEDI